MPEFEQNERLPERFSLVNKDTWDILAHKSRCQPFFTPCQADYPSGIRICDQKRRRVIKHSLGRWIHFAIFIGFVLLFGGGWIIMLGSDMLFSVFFLSFSGILLFFIFAGMAMVSSVNSIILDDTNKKLILKYGRWFWNKELCLDADKLSCRTFICDKEFSNKKIKPGMLVVALSSEYKKQEIILVASDNQKHAKKAYDAIAAFSNISDNDESLEQLELSDGRTIKYSTCCVEDELEFGRRTFKKVDKNIAVLKGGYMYFIVLLICAVMCISAIADLWHKNPIKIYDVIVCTILFGLLLSGIIVLLGWLAKRKITGFCLSEGLVYSSIFANRRFWWKKEAEICDIAALQVCSVSTLEQSGNNSTCEATVYQLLAIMADKDDNRKFLANYTKQEKILGDAEKLSDFLNRPLIDNIQK